MFKESLHIKFRSTSYRISAGGPSIVKSKIAGPSSLTENLAAYQVRHEFIPSSFQYRFVWDPVKVHIGSNQMWTGCGPMMDPHR